MGPTASNTPAGPSWSTSVGVAGLLGEWGAGEDLRAAGLCHACYGTDGFPRPLLGPDERPLLAETIGTEAERLVYLYAGWTAGPSTRGWPHRARS